ncbi:MAG: SDR family NAD(P)-dependent oxidoreductase [Pseudomonadales bacterium]|nr:SDR family NAD(P)-dependent oxidoreductase [Pseudomonadales bacterium]
MSSESALNLEALFSVSGKVALVTGGSSGLGYMMAAGLLQSGAKVYIAARKAEKCQSAARQLGHLGECIALTADVTDPEQRQALVTELSVRESAGLSILVNNAGANWGAVIDDYPDAAFDKVMSTNVNAVFALTRDLLPLLKAAAKKEDPARVVNIGSMDGLQVPIVQRVPTFAYSASKAALHHLTRALAVDLAPDMITVNAVAPGFFPSKMTDYVIEQYRKDIEDDCPLGRLGQAEEIVGVLLYLCARSGAYTTGVVIPVDGGTSISKGSRSWQKNQSQSGQSWEKEL